MKWDKLQADLIKKLIAGDKNVHYYIDGDMFVEVVQNHTIFRVPTWFMYVWLEEQRKMSKSILREYIPNMMDSKDFSQLDGFRVELIGTKPIQVFRNMETGEEIAVNTKLYSAYTEKADELTFWGTDQKSPVIAVHGPVWDTENIAFMVLPLI